jgi:hypothetical protein
MSKTKKADELLANRASRAGKRRMEKLTPEARKELARKAALARWKAAPTVPGGNASVGGAELLGGADYRSSP